MTALSIVNGSHYYIYCNLIFDKSTSWTLFELVLRVGCVELKGGIYILSGYLGFLFIEGLLFFNNMLRL